jgi:hypothetical protein
MSDEKETKKIATQELRKPRGRPAGTGKYSPGSISDVPAQYHNNMLQDMYDKMAAGRFDCEIYSSWKVSKEVFYEWKRIHPEFKRIHELGLGACEAWWIEEMRKRFLAGDDKGFKYCIAIMNTKFGWSTKDGAKTDMQINIQNMTVNQTQSKEELINQIQNLLIEQSDIITLNESEFQLLESPEQDYRRTESDI